jgi:hypothetical protein
MRELAKKQKQEEKKERKLAKQNPQPDENADAPGISDTYGLMGSQNPPPDENADVPAAAAEE